MDNIELDKFDRFLNLAKHLLELAEFLTEEQDKSKRNAPIDLEKTYKELFDEYMYDRKRLHK